MGQILPTKLGNKLDRKNKIKFSWYFGTDIRGCGVKTCNFVSVESGIFHIFTCLDYRFESLSVLPALNSISSRYFNYD